MQDQKISIVITTSDGGRPFQWAPRRRTVSLLLCLAGAAVVFMGVGAVSMVRLSSAMRTSKRVGLENDSLRVQSSRLDQLEKDLARMAELNAKMRALVGVDEQVTTSAAPDSGSKAGGAVNGPGGAGGPAGSQRSGQGDMGTDKQSLDRPGGGPGQTTD